MLCSRHSSPAHGCIHLHQSALHPQHLPTCFLVPVILVASEVHFQQLLTTCKLVPRHCCHYQQSARLRVPLTRTRHSHSLHCCTVAGCCLKALTTYRHTYIHNYILIVCAYYYPGGRCRFRRSAPEPGAGAACAQVRACAWQRSSGAEREKNQAPATAAWTATRPRSVADVGPIPRERHPRLTP